MGDPLYCGTDIRTALLRRLGPTRAGLIVGPEQAKEAASGRSTMATPVADRREAQFDFRTERDEESRQARQRLVAWSMVAVAAEKAKKAEEPGEG